MENHFRRLSRLMELEAEAEARQLRERTASLSAADAERSGNSLVDLVVAEETSGLGGRCVLRLCKRNRTLSIPWTRLRVGSPILLSVEGSKASRRGVVCGLNDRLISVAVDEPPEGSDDGRLRLDLSSDEVARLRQQRALRNAEGAKKNRLAELRTILLGETEPAEGKPIEIEPLDPALDASQREAVAHALAAPDLAVIHGPPGTGKTTAVIELIRQAVQRGAKVLACAPSNLAVDNLMERLVRADVRAVRLGHPARVLAELQAYTLDAQVDDHDDVRQARKCSKQAFALFRKAGKWTRAKPEPGARRDQRQEARALLAEARRLEARAVQDVLDKADVLCSTTTALDYQLLGDRAFDLLVIDEACQTTEPGCWIPLQRCGRLVLAGDHCQLPPTVVSAEASKQGFDVSLLERLVALYGAKITRRLQVQYRMHEAIMRFSSDEFYDGELKADATVQGHRLCDLPGVQAAAATEAAVEFIDTAGASHDEEQEPDGASRFNPEEAKLLARKVRELIDLGVPAGDIAVIAPYSAQVRLLRELLAFDGLEIDSVDGFQGREKEAVFVSLVRSNATGEIGFLADVRRMNVALTRARRRLLVVGDSATLSVHPFYQRLFAYFETLGAYRSVWEEIA